MAMLFKEDDSGYLRWLKGSPSGFVINLRRVPNVRYAVLHRASCNLIGHVRRPEGAYTERGYIKLCASSAEEAKLDLRRLLSVDRAEFSKCCEVCNPI